MGFLSSVVGSVIGAAGAAYSGKQSAKSAADQMHFQQKMSNTAHQRQVRDLEAAGINPILSAKLGGASTPAGAGYQTPNIGDAWNQGAFSNSAAQKARAETENVPKEGKIKDKQISAMEAQIKNLEAQARMYNFNSAKMSAETDNIEKQNLIMDKEVEASKIEAEIDRSDYGQALRWLGRLNPFGNAAKGLWTVPRK